MGLTTAPGSRRSDLGSPPRPRRLIIAIFAVLCAENFSRGWEYATQRRKAKLAKKSPLVSTREAAKQNAQYGSSCWSRGRFPAQVPLLITPWTHHERRLILTCSIPVNIIGRVHAYPLSHRGTFGQRG